jgi:tRNA dimethylallyltransferase
MGKDKKILILGVTASGKSGLSLALAKALDTEIISVDSMKVYRRMDIGTAKPDKDRRQQVKYHLIDVVEPSQSFSVDKFLELTETAIQDISSRGKAVLAAGGTAMYIKALLFGIFDGPGSDEQIRQNLRGQIETVGLAELHKQLADIDPVAAERIHPNDEKRIVRALEVHKLTGKPISSFQNQFDSPPPDDWIVFGIRRDKETESSRINARVKKMVEFGLLDEVKGLLAEDKPLSAQAACAIGYAEMIDHLQGKMDFDEAVEKIKINTRRLAKSQRTWFKRFTNINWIDVKEDDTIETILPQILKKLNPN